MITSSKWTYFVVEYPEHFNLRRKHTVANGGCEIDEHVAFLTKAEKDRLAEMLEILNS